MSDDGWENIQQAPQQDEWENISAAERPAPDVGEAMPEAFLSRVAQGSAFQKAVGAKVDALLGNNGPRYQLWPERMVRSGLTLAHDVMTGEVPQYDVDPDTGEVHTSSAMIQRSQDMAAFQLGQTHIDPTFSRAPLIDAGGGQLARPFVNEDGKISATTVGSLPTPQDFSAAGKVLESPHAEANLKRMWSEDGIHPAEAVHDAQSDAFFAHQVTAPSVEFRAVPEARKPPTAPDPLDLAMSGELTAKRANDVAADLKDQQTKVENEIFGDRADEWRKLHRQSDRAWNNADDAKAKATDAKIDQLEQDVGLTDQDENWLNGQGWNNQSVPEHWENLARNLNDIEMGREDAIGTVASEVRYLPKDNDWSKMTSGEQESVITVMSAMNAEKAAGRDPMTFLKDAFAERIKRYGGGADAHEVAQYQMEELANLLRNPLTRGQVHEVPMPPEEYEQLLLPGGKAASLSAAATDPGEVPLAQQPARPPGSLIASAQASANKLFDVGRDIQMKLTPMARGSVDSMATVKDYMNAMRRNAWDSSRIDTDIAKRFTAEQRERMARAMEEESLSRRLGEPDSAREHQGLATLEPEERAAVEQLDNAQQLAWLRARDAGVVDGDGIPMHFPRMALGAKGDSEIGKPPSLTQMYGIRKNSPYTKQRQYMEAEETEAALKAKYGDQAKIAWDIRAVNLATKMLEDATSGRTLINSIQDVGKRTGEETVAEGFKPGEGWFTVDHPAFQKWRPRLDENGAVKDAAGNPVFDQVPIYVRGDFEGPIRAALWGKTGETYQGMMALKGKTMGLIMNSPMIHNLVEFGRAFPAMPTRIFKAYFDGYRAKNDVGVMHEAIDAGLVPIGKRFFNQDINAIMEAPDLTPGRSWTAKVLAAVPGMFDEAAGTAVKQAIDKAGDFWHNTLLWDRVADLQMGLYTNFRGDLINKGMDTATASRIAAHFANRYAGALPKEAMSEMATKVSNFMFFSRSFTFGNLGVMKDMLTGLPKDVMSQIERDAGFRAGSIDGADVEGAVQEAASSARSIARRKAIATVALDVALMWAGNTVLQSAFNVMLGGRTLNEEEHEYIRRAKDVINDTAVHPLSLLNPFNIASIPGRLLSTQDNEPGKQNRVLIGYAKDGTAIYARNPVGKIGDEFAGYFDSPLDMMRKKEGTILRPLMQIYSNDAGFGRKIYDPHAETLGERAAAIGAMVKHLMASQLPVGQIGAFSDLIKGEGDKFVNELQAFGPFAGVTFSKGAPGGPAVGEMYDNKSRFEFRVAQAMPDLRRQIQRGDIAGAQQAMSQIGMDPSYQRWVVKTSLDPRLRLSPKSISDFYRTAGPEQQGRMRRIQQAPSQP